MNLRPLGKTGLEVSVLGFGAFKIGRNQGIKYAQGYDLPAMPQVQQLIDGLLQMGVNYLDTAPAYGLSEERLGATLPASREGVVVSTKVGETFEQGVSHFDFSEAGVQASVRRSLNRLKCSALDVVFIHSNGQDMSILEQTPVVATLQQLKAQGLIRAIGFSGKTVEGAHASLRWADVLMVEYHLEDRSHEDVIAQAASQGVGVVVKKGLASGRLPAEQAIEFILANPGVSSLIIGGLNLNHIRSNVEVARRVLGG
jgi:aryl-alcohol dehydrogenase-like predicted oxidoreductase